MKYILSISIMLFMVGLAIGQANPNLKQAPLPLAVFDDNVNAPLTVKERNYIMEVYGDYAEQYVFSNPNRLKDIKNILRNRVILNEYPKKDLSSITKLSSVPLLKAFNPNVSRDASININNFNPLKYQFNFFSRESQIKYYWVDNTQLLISILPQHN